MNDKFPEKAKEIMNERFHHDSLIALATIDGQTPWVRTIDGYYEDGAFYAVTYSLSNKMKQIQKNPAVAVSGDWFTAHGIGENLGHILLEKNATMAAKLRNAFSAWYNNGDVDESDPNTCILCIHLTDGVLISDEKRYDIDFTKE